MVLEVWDGKQTYRKSRNGNLPAWSDLTLSPLQGKTRKTKLKSAYNSLIIGPRDLGWQTNLYEIMNWQSSGVVGFDLEPLLQGQTRIAKAKSAHNLLIFGLRDLGC